MSFSILACLDSFSSVLPLAGHKTESSGAPRNIHIIPHCPFSHFSVKQKQFLKNGASLS